MPFARFFRWGFALMLVSCGLVPPTVAAPDSSFTPYLMWSGAFVGRVSWGQSNPESTIRQGWGIRQLQLHTRAFLRPHLGVSVRVNGNTNAFYLLNVHAFYAPTPTLRIRMGRLISAKPALTPVWLMDSVDRAAVETLWNRRTIGADGHDFGLDIQYSLGPWSWTLFLHNGDGHWDRTRGNVNPSLGPANATNRIDQRSGAISLRTSWTSSHHRPLQVHVHTSYNGSRNPNTAWEDRRRTYRSYGGQVHWGALPGSQPMRLKLDVSTIQYETVDGYTERQYGWTLVAATQLHTAAEWFGRLERDHSNSGAFGPDRYFGTGISFSPSALRGHAFYQERLVLAIHCFRNEISKATETSLIFQLQLVF